MGGCDMQSYLGYDATIEIDADMAKRITDAVEWREGDDPAKRLYPGDQWSFTEVTYDGHSVELVVYGGDYEGVVAMMYLYDSRGAEVDVSDDEPSPWGTWTMSDDETEYKIEVIAAETF